MSKSKEKKSLFYRALDGVERAGNRLPHPFTLFVMLTAFVIIISVLMGILNVQVQHPTSGDPVVAKSLLSKEGLQYMFINLTSNFASFKPLGLVLTMMLGIGLAEQTGLMNAFMKKFIMGAPEKLLVAAIFIVGICGNIASDAAVIIIPPLAGAIFYGAKKNPLLGIAVGYSAACAGFTANLLIVGTDALLAGITEEVARIIDPAIEVTPAINYYFMIVSTFLLTGVGVWVTSIMEKRMGPYQPKGEISNEDDTVGVSEKETKALKKTGLATLIYWGIVILIMIPTNSPFRNPDGGIVPSPFLSGIVTFIFLWFLIIGITYGRNVGVIKSESDIPKLMGTAMKDMSGYIVLVFIIAQFINYFNWTNIGLILAVSLGNLLKVLNFTGIPMVILVILFTMIVNLFIGSGSAKWALLAPVFVPMFMMLDYSPAFAQIAYRIGDSTTNSITPLFPYFPILLGFFKKYDDDTGIGTAMSLTIPFAMAFGVVWIVQLIVWYMLNLPLGPGATIFG